MTSVLVANPARTRRADWAGFASDVRHAVLALLAAGVILGATTPSWRTVLLAVVLAAMDVKRDDWRPVLLVLAFVGVYWAATGWSENPVLSSRIWTDQAKVAVMFVAYRIAVTDRRALCWVSIGYLAGSVLLIRELLQENLAASLNGRPSSSGAVVRYTIEGVNANYIAFTLAGAFAILILLGQAVPRIWALALIPLGIVFWRGIQLNDTRAAMVAAEAAVLWWALIRGDRLRRTALWVLVAVVGVIAVGIFTGAADDRLRSLFTSTTERDAGGLNGRLDFWPLAREAYFDHPWLGIGPGAVTRHLPHGVFAHNVFLDVGTSAGLVGIVMFVAALWAILFRATRNLTDSRRYMLIGVAICATAAPLLAGYWYQTAPFWLLLALFSRMGVLEARRDGDEA